MTEDKKKDDHDLAEQVEALLHDGETLLWWDRLSDKSIMGGFGRTLVLFTLAVNIVIVLLIFAPSLVPSMNSLSWLTLPLLVVDCICLLFILLYFAFGLVTGGVNVITSERVLVADLHSKKVLRFMNLDSLTTIRVRQSRNDRGDLTFFRDDSGEYPATAKHPRRIAMRGLRYFSRVLELLREETDVLDP